MVLIVQYKYGINIKIYKSPHIALVKTILCRHRNWYQKKSELSVFRYPRLCNRIFKVGRYFIVEAYESSWLPPETL